MFESLQRESPELEVLVFGRIPENRYAFFYYGHSGKEAIVKRPPLHRKKGHYVIPYPY